MEFDKIPTPEELDLISDPETKIIPLFEAARIMEKASGGKDKFPVGFELFSQVMTGGVTDGDLVVISGKSGHGKTTFAQTISYHLAQIGLPQLWFSYEMQITEIANKFAAMGLNDEFLGFCPLKLKGGSIDWIEQKITEGVVKHNVKAIFIDHLGFLTPKIKGNETNMERNFSAYLGQICRQLKSLAIEKNIIIFLLAHVRKTKEELDIDDIAHSVGVAQEADFVFMVEREKQKQNSKWAQNEMGDMFTEFSRIMLVKNRRTGINKFIKCQMSNGRLTEVAKHGNPTDPSIADFGEIILGD